MMLPIRVVWHYKFNCPYCNRFEKYVLNPLEEKGVVEVRRVCMDSEDEGIDVSMNVITSVVLSGERRVETPLLIVPLPNGEKHVFTTFKPYMGAGVKEAVQVMAANFLMFLYKRYGIAWENFERDVRINIALLKEG